MLGNMINLDAPLRWQLGFQDPATPVMEGIINFHHDLFFFLVIILVFVVRILYRTLYLYSYKKNSKIYDIVHAPFLEVVWTVVPVLILLSITFPSFVLLYSLEEIYTPLFTVKVIGHQWYWSYEFTDPNLFLQEINSENEYASNFSFDSYMVPDDELTTGALRLLEVDNRLYLPTEVNIRLLVSSADVLHSWAVPSLGVKIDACPGRINSVETHIKRDGVFYGQCSEICGINHGFMPIVVEGVWVMPHNDLITPATMQAIYPLFMAIYYPDK